MPWTIRVSSTFLSAASIPSDWSNIAMPQSPVSVSLEAFSPFIPLSPHDSHLPATVLQFTVKNRSGAKVEGELAGWLQNAVCIGTGDFLNGTRINTVVRRRPGQPC